MEFATLDPDALYMKAFYSPGGLEKMLELMESREIAASAKVRENVRDIYLSHIRYVIATDWGEELLLELSKHLLKARDVLNRRKATRDLVASFKVFEDMVDDALAFRPRPKQEVMRTFRVAVPLLKELSLKPVSITEVQRKTAWKPWGLVRVIRRCELEGYIRRTSVNGEHLIALTHFGAAALRSRRRMVEKEAERDAA